MKCKQCNKTTTKKNSFKQFCGRNCWENHRYKNDLLYRIKKISRAKAYHLEHKHESKYKKKHYKCVKKWIENNRDRFNDLCRERNKLYQRKLHEYRTKNGLCRGCGKVGMGDDIFKNCFRCRKKARNFKLIQAAKKRKARG